MRRGLRSRGRRAGVALAALVPLACALGWGLLGWRSERALAQELSALLRTRGEAFEQTVMTQPMSQELRSELAGLALGTAEELLQRDPTDAVARVEYAHILFRLGKFGAAKDEFDRACRSAPADPAVWTARAWFHTERYLRIQPLPFFEVSSGGIRVDRSRESGEARGHRETALRDLETARTAGIGGRLDEKARLAEACLRACADPIAAKDAALGLLEGLESPRAHFVRGICSSRTTSLKPRSNSVRRSTGGPCMSPHGCGEPGC